MGVVVVRRMCVLGFALVALAGCGSSNKAASTSTPGTTTTAKIPPVSEDATLAAEVPAAIRSAGTLTVGTDATYAPNEFLSSGGKAVMGMDPDLINAIAEVLGLKPRFVNEQFQEIIPAVVDGRFTVGASSITDTKEREQEVDFVTYLSAGQALLSKTGGAHVSGLGDVCGRRVAIEKGTLEQGRIIEQARKCCEARGRSGSHLQQPG